MAFSDTAMCWELLSVKTEQNGDNDIIRTTASFITEQKQWSGTATELLAKLTRLNPNIAVKSNRLSGVLFDAKAELFADFGIEISKDRTSSKKTITLRLCKRDEDDAGDRHDSDDDSDDTGVIRFPDIV